LLGVTIEPPAVNGGTSLTATVTLNGPARTLTSIGLVSDNPAATVPPFVMVPAGSATAVFPITTTNVPSDTYVDVLPGIDAAPPRLRINAPPMFNGLSYVCSDGKARVVVEEIDVRQTGDVERFVATIDQQCAVRSDRIHAEIRLTRPPQLGGGVSPVRCTP
jgi:hypothetical protein